MKTLVIFDRAGMDDQRTGSDWRSLPFACMLSLLLNGMAQAETDGFLQGIDGDVGLGGYYTRSIIRGKSDALSILPYADFKYGRLFARVDTLGIKTVELGYGYLELVGRVSQDGFSTDNPSLQGLGERKNSLPLGIGTLQVTPAGGFWLNAFHDVHRSKGNWFEAIYGGKIGLPRLDLYPLLGAEYQSAEYVGYYYGVSAPEAAGSQYAAYQPAGSFNGLAGLIADFELSDGYHLNCYVRRKWLGDAIRHSPIVSRRYLDTAYLALSYRFR